MFMNTIVLLSDAGMQVFMNSVVLCAADVYECLVLYATGIYGCWL